jgi:glycosyltransferase involved in cell wall biosynthesis
MVANSSDLKILVFEPYYGGSHKSFFSALKQLPFQFEFMTLPARKWKWRMRLAAPFYAQKLHKTGKRYDRILCSSYIDVAAFRGLAPAWVQEVPLLTYFHENQFAYPVREENERDFHFSLTNMTTALASDSLAFNSEFNRTSFLEGIVKLLKLSHDLKLHNPSNTIRKKSRILPPGIDFSAIDNENTSSSNQVPVIVWNHRWEHDKNPELFFETLFELDQEELDFRFIVLGQSFKTYPSIFDDARVKLSHRILHFGYSQSQKEYIRLLKRGDIVVSTAHHEFFGIAILEAVRAGCIPLLPKRLSYPEIFPQEFLYGEGELYSRLKDIILSKKRLSPHQTKRLTEPFSCFTLAQDYISWIQGKQTN